MNRRVAAAPLRAAIGLAVAVAAVAAIFTARPTLASATITVDPTVAQATVGPVAVGLNTAVWDGHLQDAAVPGLLAGVGTKLLRFPGGSTADVYHWQTNSITPGQAGYANPANTFDSFMQHVARPAGAQAMVTVNYGSNAAGTGGGDPREAAAWVNYANNVQHYGVKYWEIGNEIYGNGYYGSAWEVDLHGDHSPTAYAENALAYIQAMKAEDPTIQVGLVLTAPGNWPDGQGPQVWNPTVLAIACDAADFVSVHWYAQQPGSETDSGLLASSGQIPGMVSQLRSELNQYCGAHAAQMGIMVTESNSVAYNPGKQTTSVVNGLFLAQDYLSWLQAGVQNVTWWDLHNGSAFGNNDSGSLLGTADYGDYGVLSNASTGEPPANTPFPSYTALQVLSRAVTAGATFVATTSALPGVDAWALRQPDGDLALALVNTTANAAAVTPSTGGFAASAASVTAMSLASPQLTTTAIPVQNGTVNWTIPGYAAAVITLSPGGSSSTPSPTATVAPTPTPTMVAMPTPTTAPTPTPTPTSTPVVIGNFENGTDGFQGNGAITSMGPSTWSPTVALGSYSLWTQYNVPSSWTEAQVYKTVNLDLSADSTLSVSVYPKQPTVSGPGVKVRFLVQGSDGNWYASPYQSVPIGVRSTVSWNMGEVPRSPMRMIYVCWQFTTSATSSGNELWLDALTAS
ncbi:MAG TPA: hypothetical protein VFN57_00175 [Thermomicrobiaceae bacterium]|nr:hypothetical protein [Thermomicrobiaceae bacterium]